MHADNVTTPLLILHGEADLRVPTFQGREFRKTSRRCSASLENAATRDS